MCPRASWQKTYTIIVDHAVVTVIIAWSHKAIGLDYTRTCMSLCIEYEGTCIHAPVVVRMLFVFTTDVVSVVLM